MNAPVALTPELLTQLTAIVGENRIKTDADSPKTGVKIIPSILIRTHRSSFFRQRLNKFRKL